MTGKKDIKKPDKPNVGKSDAQKKGPQKAR
jgi:hypothetical protein